MPDVFIAMDILYTLLAAGALAMIAFAQKELRAARVLIVLVGFLVTTRWIMWAFTTDQPWYLRSLVGALFGAFLLGALPALYSWAKAKSSPEAKASQPSSEANSKPIFSASGEGSEISGKGMQVAGTPPFQIGRAESGGKISLDGSLWVMPNASTEFPPPTGEFSSLSNSKLKEKVSSLVEQLPRQQAEYDKENAKIPPTADRNKIKEGIAKRAEIRQKYASVFGATIGPAAKSLVSEVIFRVAKAHALDNVSISPDAQAGAQVILQNKFAGASPAGSAANFLDAFAKGLPNS
jgi:hypothetical protein